MSTLDTGVTLAIGAAAVVLSENCPAGATLINTGTDRVWIGGNSNVGPNDGIPLEGSTSLALNPGELWAVLDAAATSSAVVYLSSLPASQWQASPAAIGDQVAAYMVSSGLAAEIGVQVAQQANALGIPDVYHGTVLQKSVVLPANATSYEVPFDLSAYASVTVSLGLVPGGQQVTFAWVDQAGGTTTVATHNFLATGTNGPANSSGISVTLPVETGTLRILLSSGAGSGTFTTRITTAGSNRPIPLTVGGLDLGVDLSKTQPFTNNTVVALGTITTAGGQHWCRFLCSSSGAGYFGYVLSGTTNVYVWRNQVTTGGADNFAQVALPPGCVGLVFLPTVTGTYVVEWSVTPTKAI